MPLPIHEFPDTHLLTPREVAEIFGVRTTTIARWARDGRLACTLTPGGHRRYQLIDVKKLIDSIESTARPEDAGRRELEQDAARMYDAGWNIRQVAERFGYSYSAMRRVLMKRTILRT